MSVLIGYINLLIIIIMTPLLIGLNVVNDIFFSGKITAVLYSYVMGVFSFFAIFEFLFFGAAFFDVPFNIISLILCGLVLLLVIISCIFIRKKNVIKGILDMKSARWTKYEVIILVVFLALFVYQLYYAFFYSRTYMADDGYVAFSSTALADNYINQTDFHTGNLLVHNAEWYNRIVQSFNYFPAFLSFISGINVSIISHTVLYTWIVILAYAVYYIFADLIFDRRDNKLIFISLVAALFIWGYHSHYSLTFRLLGPNDSGKAVLAVVLAPFMLTVIYQSLKTGYCRLLGLQVLFLSIDACALTLGGIYTFAALLCGMVILTFLRTKSAKPLLYLLWGGFVPLLFAILYLSYR